jgi:RNA polymerase sigma factor (sigma-70 family)
MKDDEFRVFVEEYEPRLHRAFVAKFGWDVGREATAEALAYAWEYWDKVHPMANPGGYLFRVGRSRVRRRRQAELFVHDNDQVHWYEPGLDSALRSLSERQRLAVVLVHGYAWTTREVADMTGLRITTIESHLERGIARLRRALSVESVNHV